MQKLQTCSGFLGRHLRFSDRDIRKHNILPGNGSFRIAKTGNVDEFQHWHEES